MTLSRALVLFFAALSACGQGPRCDSVAAEPDGAFAAAVTKEQVRVTYTDGTVRVLPRRPRRIVSALPGITEMIPGEMYLAGLGE